MATTSIRLHGDAPLIDPELLKGYCSNCKHEREGRIVETHQANGAFEKACKNCGLQVLANLPSQGHEKKPEGSEPGGQGNILTRVVQGVRNEFNKWKPK